MAIFLMINKLKIKKIQIIMFRCITDSNKCAIGRRKENRGIL